MLTIDTIPLSESEKRKVISEKARFTLRFNFPRLTIYFLYAAYGSGSGDKIY